MNLSPEAVGVPLVAGHLLDLALVAFLLLSAVGMGIALLRRLSLRPPDPLADLAFGVALGLAVLANGFLALGALGWLRAWSVWLVILAAAGLGRREIAALPATMRKIPRFMEERGGWGVSLAWGVGVLGLTAVFLGVLGAGPPVDWDSLMYHLTLPARFLGAGRIFMPEDNLHVSFVGLLHMLYFPLLALGSGAAPALLNGALALLLGLTVFSLGVRFFDGETGSVGMGSLWGTTTLLLVAITPRTDTTLALFLLLAHYAFLLALEEEDPRRWLCFGAALVGFGAGIKLNGLAYGAALAPLALWASWNRSGGGEDGDGEDGSGRRIRGTLGAILLMAAVGLVVLAPWLAKNWALLGAPLYPFFAHRTVEPWLQALYDAAPDVPAPDASLSQSIRGVRAPVSLWGIFFAPGGLTAEGEGAWYFTSRFLLLLPLGVFFLRRKNLAWLAAPPILYLALILLPFPSTNLRYLVPAVPALTVAAAFSALETARRYLPDRVATVLILILATLSLEPSGRAAMRWLSDTEAVPHLLGAASTRAYWEGHPDPGVRAYAPVVRHVNETLDPGDRILMLFEARGFPMEAGVIQDNKITNWPYLAGVLPEGSCGEAVGADYLLLASAALNYYRLRGLDPGRLDWDRFDGFAARCLEPVFQVPGYVLFRWGGSGSR